MASNVDAVDYDFVGQGSAANVALPNDSDYNYTEVGNNSAAFYKPSVEEMFYYYLWTVVTPTIFALITVIGTAGNVLVIYVIFSKPAMRTVTNYLLVNLACADISFLLICVPFTAYKYASSNWPFGDLACKLVQYFLYVTAYVTIYTLVAISALRFCTVVYNNQTTRCRTKGNTILLIVAIWIAILLVNVPAMMYHRQKQFGLYISYCGMEDHAVGPIFINFFVFAYAVPLVIICILYLLIMLHLRRNQPSTLDQSRERTNRAFRVVVVVVVTFAVSWLPQHINSFLGYLGMIPKGPYYDVFRILGYCMSYGNSCANPFIYNYASMEFRKAFQETMCTCKNTSEAANRRQTRLEIGTTSETAVMVTAIDKDVGNNAAHV